MKKLLITTLIAFTLNATSAFAKCEGGTIVTGVENNHDYCVSSTTMVWWSAIVWCEQQGRKLATLNQACNGWNSDIVGNGTCPNLAVGVNKVVWTVNPSGDSNAYIVNLSSGNVSSYNRTGYYFTYYSALCY